MVSGLMPATAPIRTSCAGGCCGPLFRHPYAVLLRPRRAPLGRAVPGVEVGLVEQPGASLQPQSFIRMLAETPRTEVREKLVRWGVADYSSIFTRAVGRNALFREPAPFDSLSEEFLRNYHR